MSEPSESAVPGLAGFETTAPFCRSSMLSPARAPVSHASSTDPLPCSVTGGAGLLIVSVIGALVVLTPLLSVATLCNAYVPLGKDFVFQVPTHP